ncbi:hypothetical protein DUNSADRAFT_9210 [Dunaliella salina]|uniref:Encoded protein n=1 Tax=Dunaliella salina TaxID=3046 RepID=A0ABQ7GHY1_DUNSA|nr:hypothetical protein DUNSADRAFT_9210 [Dunaliella salina]|eukprot:KAF5834220.1 hypothetical protein DUNSADRAFT_9210 [Dunaliella salina]
MRTYIHTCTVHFSQFSYYNDSHCTSDVHHGSDQSIARVCKQNFKTAHMVNAWLVALWCDKLTAEQIGKGHDLIPRPIAQGEHGVPRHVGLPCLMP